MKFANLIEHGYVKVTIYCHVTAKITKHLSGKPEIVEAMYPNRFDTNTHVYIQVHAMKIKLLFK